jgi:hypothetical protein
VVYGEVFWLLLVEIPITIVGSCRDTYGTLINIVLSTNAAFSAIILSKLSVSSEICFLLPWLFSFCTLLDDSLSSEEDRGDFF